MPRNNIESKPNPDSNPDENFSGSGNPDDWEEKEDANEGKYYELKEEVRKSQIEDKIKRQVEKNLQTQIDEQVEKANKNKEKSKEVERFETDNISEAMKNIGYKKGIVKIIELKKPRKMPDGFIINYYVEFDAQFNEDLLKEKVKGGGVSEPIYLLPTTRPFHSLEEAEKVAKEAIKDIDYWNTDKYQQ